MKPRSVVLTPHAEQPDGPYYSQALIVGEFIFVSGQLGIDGTTGRFIPGGVLPEAEQVMNNLTHVLEASGCTWQSVVQMTIYVVDMERAWTSVEPVIQRFVEEPFPACTAVGVTTLAKGGHIEIELVAIRDTDRPATEGSDTGA